MKIVKSNLKDKTRVAFFEQHPDHPDGEAFISDDKQHKVGDTQAVRSAIQAGKLVEVEVKKKAPAKGKIETEPIEEPVPEKQPEPVKGKPKATKGK